MAAKTTGNWLVDLHNLTCRNIETRIIISFVKKGAVFSGTIKYIPIELADKWTADSNKEEKLKKTIIEAEEVFFHAYFSKEKDAIT